MAITLSFLLRTCLLTSLWCTGMCTIAGMAAVHPIDETPKKNHQQLYDKEPYVSTDSVYCIIPFSRAGNLIIIRAKADSIEGNFILDTGAPGLVLNSTYFRNFPTIETSIEISGGLTGAAENGGRTSITNFSFGPVKYSGVEADRIYMGHIENNKGIQIHGLLGMQLFSHFEMIIDYEANLLHLHHISKKDGKNYKHPLLADTSMYFEHNIEFIENKLITQAWAGGKKLKFVIDTGAESNLLDSRLPDKVMDAVDITRRVILNGAANKKVEALSGNLGSIKIGQYDADNLPVVITNLEKLCYAYDKCLDGMLGFDFLSRQKIGFNFVKRKMYIWK